MQADTNENSAHGSGLPVVLDRYPKNDMSVIGLGGLGVGCVSRLAADMHSTAGETPVRFIGVDGTQGMPRRLLSAAEFVILVGGLGGGPGMALPRILASPEHEQSDPRDSFCSFVAAVVILPFAADRPDLDVADELERLKEYTDMVCVVSHDAWAARLGTASKAEVTARCEREVDRCVSAFIHGLPNQKQHIVLDTDLMKEAFGWAGHVPYGQGRMRVGRDDEWEESARAAIQQAGMEQAIVGAGGVAICFACPPGAKGRSLKAVMTELRRHVGANARITQGIRYDAAIPADMLQFDLWATV